MDHKEVWQARSSRSGDSDTQPNDPALVLRATRCQAIDQPDRASDPPCAQIQTSFEQQRPSRTERVLGSLPVLAVRIEGGNLNSQTEGILASDPHDRFRQGVAVLFNVPAELEDHVQL